MTFLAFHQGDRGISGVEGKRARGRAGGCVEKLCPFAFPITHRALIALGAGTHPKNRVPARARLHARAAPGLMGEPG